MKLKQHTRADLRHYEDVLDALNDAYLDGKPMIHVLEVIVARRLAIQSSYDDKLFKARYQLKMAAARFKELGLGP